MLIDLSLKTKQLPNGSKKTVNIKLKARDLSNNKLKV